MPTTDPRALVGALAEHQSRARRALNLTPSENTMSPLARVPLVCDVYSRYFFDHLRLLGSWSFYGGLEPGRIELDILVPLLRELAGAAHVDVRPISGLNCMTVALAALCPRGGTVYTVPLASGGHMSTPVVADQLGLRTVPLPMDRHHDVDPDRLADLLRRDPADLIYLDQSTQLFPLDAGPVRDLADRLSPRTLIHYDSSHVNGLVLGGAVPNPLRRGAHTFGGSTHKTLPGPHKGFLATDDEELAKRIGAVADHLVSHHHLGEVVSLAVTLLELRDRDGAGYARKVIDNARVFARTMHRHGRTVAAADRGFTGCHQVWVRAGAGVDPHRAADRMYAQGLLVNKLDGLPGLDGTSFRLSVAEVTRLGAGAEHASALGEVVAALLGDEDADRTADIARLRSSLSHPRYCYTSDEVERMGAPGELLALMRAIETLTGAG
ncbi:hypothetical protein AQ490_11350 [Wenjunlia vitaminophila]|uniref:Serine hydroxymethyltransferase-like domain-containing protein n=1 Tax=Wenjunlia vitaminophila TaxID=76728 RepID=A0A0T6LK57_WENVI|nr:hypothetical protein [Wenjunlia vitaminophila]KRV46487.1 hypothetical protein AQ490_11350 [Wenjunlia vitaminophila]